MTSLWKNKLVSFFFFLAKQHCIQDLTSLIKPTLLAVETWNLNHWISREDLVLS